MSKMIEITLASAILALIIIVALPTALTPYSNYKNFYLNMNKIPQSHISKDEFDAANWLRNNINIGNSPNPYVVSDYATSWLIRGMTGLNTTASRPPNVTSAKWDHTPILIRSIFGQHINASTSKAISSLQKETQSTDVYIVLSKRTCWWMKQDDPLKIRYLPLPYDYKWINYCSDIDRNFKNAKGFLNIFHNEGVTIYKYIRVAEI